MKVGKNETGRTMVEMLSVLAIMGILSIVAVIIYQYATIKNKVNGIVQESQKQAMITSTSLFSKSTIESSEVGVLRTGYGYKVSSSDMLGHRGIIKSEDGFFGVYVEEVPNEVIEKLFERAQNSWTSVHKFGIKQEEQLVHITNESECQNALTEESADIVLIYASDFTDRNCTLETCVVEAKCQGKVCPPGSICKETGCVCENGNDLCGNVCCSDTAPFCGDNGVCSQCENGYLDSTGTTPTCRVCGWGGSTAVPKNECYNCSDRFVNYQGRCMHCDRADRAAYVLNATDCLRCPNRVLTSASWYGSLPSGTVGGCYYCDPVYGIQTPNGDDCLPNPDMPCPDTVDGTPQYFAFGYCSSCANTETNSGDHTSREECLRCLGDRYYSSTENRCVGTSEYTTETLRRNYEGVVKEDCLAMKDFTLFYYNGNCEWCPTEIITVNGEKTCADTCPDGTYLYLEHKQWGQNSCCPDNATCAARKTKCKAGYYLNGDSCSACPEGTTSSVGATSIDACK